MERKRDRSRYQVTSDGDIQRLLPKEQARKATAIHLDVGRFLFVVRNLRAEVDLSNGLRLGPGGLIAR